MNVSKGVPMFTFNGQQLRGAMLGGQPGFHATDACKCVGLDISSGTTSALRHLDADERRMLRRAELPVNFMGSNAPFANFASRPGLFKLIQRSNKPEAREFDRWVERWELNPFVRPRQATARGSGSDSEEEGRHGVRAQDPSLPSHFGPNCADR
jgi:anti-repressor protein